uniref:RING-type domain-containing protein n=1 Tax=Ascaris lumbricoides TaxID=6252 RepID=A0A0M3IE70_ASCLU
MSVDTPGPSVETMSDPTFIDPIDALAICQVCLEPFSEVEHIPKLLPCGHTFCENCIISLAKTYIYTCKCPKCRAVFMLRYDTVFPTNYSLMETLFTSTPDLSADEEVFGYGASPYMDSDEENDSSEIEEQLSPYESIDVAPMSNEQGPASAEGSAPGIDERRTMNVPVEQPSGGTNSMFESSESVHVDDEGPAVESDLPQTESRGAHASTMSTNVCTNSHPATENSPKGNILRWSLVVLLELAMLLIIVFWTATFMSLIYVRYNRQNDEPSLLCTSLEMIDSWLSTKLAPSVNCQRTKSQSLFEHLNTEAEHLASDVYDIVSYIGSSTVDCFSGTSSKLMAYVTSFVNTALEKSYTLKHFMSGLISDMYSAVLMLQKALHDALLSRRSNDPIEEL